MHEPQTVIITGASSGIGRALTLYFVRQNRYVIAAARNKDMLQETQNLCRGLPGKCYIVPADVTDPEQCRNLIEQAIQLTGNIHVLINNAGISMRALFSEVQLDVLHRLMNVNFWGTVYCTYYALPYLLKTKGSLAGISSIAGYRGLPARSGYSASKFAMHGFLESLRSEYCHSGLHILIAAPGFTASDIRNRALDPKGNVQKESPLDENKIMPADIVARKIYQAVQKRKKILTITTQGKLTVWLNKWFPGWMDHIVYKHFKKEAGSPVQ